MDGHRYVLDDPEGKRMRRRVKPFELLVVDESKLRPLARGLVQAVEKRQKHIDRVVREGIVDEAKATEHVDALARPSSLPELDESAPLPRRSTRERRAPVRFGF